MDGGGKMNSLTLQHKPKDEVFIYINHLKKVIL